ncbi:hypothetical protein [Pseudovibrio sp. SPO723]|uniref:hypothetical protein n=1 Tax=Nesiotobacter zosterae TaxID=392721 RepID=UPI0029C47A84|nr:hypothetical protein [Pseudovibrio sp. SPO723]MDX5592547.1 hypothetical protein [Pseudovibrio sp. SPO723]
MNRSRTDKQVQDLVAGATKLLIEDVGGAEVAVEVTGASRSAVYKWPRADEQTNITTCNLFKLSEFQTQIGKGPTALIMMLRELGYSVVKLPEDVTGVDAMGEVVRMATMLNGGLGECLKAVEDGIIEDHEIEAISDEVSKAYESLSLIKAARSHQSRGDVVNPFKRESAA